MAPTTLPLVKREVDDQARVDHRLRRARHISRRRVNTSRQKISSRATSHHRTVFGQAIRSADTGKAESSAGQLTTTCSTAPRQFIFDLTVETEHCTICSNVLGKGRGFISRMFAYESCGCVICGECLLSRVPEHMRLSSGLRVTAWCLKSDHFAAGLQIADEVFNLDCSICLETSAEMFERPCRRRDLRNVDRIYTPCGHVFCRSCIERAVERGGHICPNCRDQLPTDLQELRSLKTVPCGDAREMEGETGST